MKSNSKILVLFILFACSLTAQNNRIKGSGTTISEKRTVAQFDQVAVSGHFNVTLTKGNGTLIDIKAEDNLMDYIITEVNDGALKIKFKKNFSYRSNKSINIVVHFYSLKSISLSGSGEIIGADEIKSDTLKVALSGSGDIQLNVSTNDISTSISGSGDIKITGATNTFTGSISGSGDFDCADLNSDIANVKISGSGDVKIRVEKEIYAKASGSGDIYYYGNPSIIKAKSSGSGSIQKRN